jgi:hypothetical protein
MKSLATLSIVLWIAMWIALHLDSPVGYVIAVLGVAASAAVVIELPAKRSGKRRSRAADGAKQAQRSAGAPLGS